MLLYCFQLQSENQQRVFQERDPSERLRSFGVPRPPTTLPALKAAVDPLRRDLDGPIRPETAIIDHLENVIKTNMNAYKVEYQGVESPLSHVPRNVRFLNMWRLFPKMLAMKAATERVSERALVEQLPAMLEDFAEALEKEGDFEPLDIAIGRLQEDLHEDNPGLQDTMARRPILPRHKETIKSTLRVIDEDFIKKLRDEYDAGDDFDARELEFAEKTELPFLREYMVSEATLKNFKIVTLCTDYATAVQMSLLNTITDAAAKKELSDSYAQMRRSGFANESTFAQVVDVLHETVKIR